MGMKRIAAAALALAAVGLMSSAASAAPPVNPNPVKSHDPFQSVDGLILDDLDKAAAADRIKRSPQLAAGSIYYVPRLAISDEEVHLIVPHESFNRADQRWGYHGINERNIDDRVICIRPTGEIRLYTAGEGVGKLGINPGAPHVAFATAPLQTFKFPHGFLFIFNRDAVQQGYARRFVLTRLLGTEPIVTRQDGQVLMREDVKQKFLEACPVFK